MVEKKGKDLRGERREREGTRKGRFRLTIL
jgi:hypothetical protein